MTPAEVRAVAGRLDRHDRKMLLAASTRPKSWFTLKRHAKIDPRHTISIRRLRECLEPINEAHRWHSGYRLTSLGRQVAALLREDQACAKK